MDFQTPEMNTIRVESELTGLSYDFLRKACLQGKIVHIKVGSKYLINHQKLIEWLQTSHGEDVD